jgi:hypothetical protein
MSNIKQIFFPITRAFDGKNGHYVYGELPFIPDSLDTMLSQELVENNLERLRKFPSARFQHKEPIGKIDFEHSVNGYRTYVDDTAFHVLIKIFDVCEKEFSMINEGSYGLSYGLMPKKTEHRRVNGKDVEVFLEGDLYEVSIVDSPALDSPLTVVRSMNKITKVTKVYDGDILYSEKTEKVDSLEPTKKLRTLRGFDLVEIEQKDGKIITNFPEKTEEPKPNISDPTLQEVERLMKKQERGMANPNFEQQHRKQVFPEICSAQCPNVQCAYRRPENFGKPCLSRFDEPDERVR